MLVERGEVVDRDGAVGRPFEAPGQGARLERMDRRFVRRQPERRVVRHQVRLTLGRLVREV